MTDTYQRRAVLKTFLGLGAGTALAGLPLKAFAAGIPALMHKNPTCSCCETYAEYLNKNGFTVDVQPTNDLDQIAAKLGVPESLRGCHTIEVGNYLIEGFVPVEHIRKLATDPRKIRGLAMPGMPMGIPNMGFPLMPGMAQEVYTTMAFTTDGKVPFVFATYPNL